MSFDIIAENIFDKGNRITALFADEGDVWLIFAAGLILGGAVCLVIRNLVFRGKLESLRASIREENDREREEIHRAINNQKRFIANMSHEIRTPINTIIGLNEMNLRQEELNDEVAENCHNIGQASKMLLAIINDILDFSKIESGKMDIIPENYKVADMLSETVNMNISKIEAKNLNFELNVPPDMPVELCGDMVRIKQILINIFTNAVKYTEKGLITLSLRFERKSEEEIILVASVSDTGKGMRPESMVHLFDAFQRVDEKDNRYIEGTGLGLAITKQLTELMGGTIAVDSIYKKGSVFTVRIPQKVTDNTPIGPIAEALKNKTTVHAGYKARFAAPDASVLVVDDNRLNLMVAVKLLKDTRMRVDTAESGQEALELTGKNYYNVILMDHQMPGMGGPETLNAIRDQEEGFCRDVPVVALTANAGSDMEGYYKRLGFQGYIVKPINSALLESTILGFLPGDLADIYEMESGKELDVDVAAHIRKPCVITVESFCDISPELGRDLDISTIPVYIQTPNGRYLDRTEIFTDNLWDKATGSFKSFEIEIPSEKDYEKFFARMLQDYENVIHIAPIAGDVGCYRVASNVAKSFGHVYVVDSGNFYLGQGLVACKLAGMVRDGIPVGEVVDAAERISRRVSTYYIQRELGKGDDISPFRMQLARIMDVLNIRIYGKSTNGSIKMGCIHSGSGNRFFLKFIRKVLGSRFNIDKNTVIYTYVGISPEVRRGHIREIERILGKCRVYEAEGGSGVISLGGQSLIGLVVMEKE